MKNESQQPDSCGHSPRRRWPRRPLRSRPPEHRDALRRYRTEQLAIAEANSRQSLLAELRMVNGPYDNVGTEFDWAVERWRPVVDMYFPEDRVEWALRIMECESRGDPHAKNPNSSASGLFQHLARLGPGASRQPPVSDDADVFDPFANIAVAAWLLDNGGTIALGVQGTEIALAFLT